MEKTLSPEEKIRRAEEIYYRRKVLEGNRNYARVNIAKSKKDFGILKKMIIQIIICCLIYTFFALVQKKEYIFSEDIIKKTKKILSYDINVSNLYKEFIDFFNSFINDENINNQKNEKDTENQQNEEITNEETSEGQNNNEKSDAIGGEIVKEVQEETELTQMEQDARNVTSTKSLIVPLVGAITSRFGPRESENPIVSKNHTGIDIAANEGTIFVASMEGTVDVVSSIRRVRKSLRDSK